MNKPELNNIISDTLTKTYEENKDSYSSEFDFVSESLQALQSIYLSSLLVRMGLGEITKKEALTFIRHGNQSNLKTVKETNLKELKNKVQPGKPI